MSEIYRGSLWSRSISGHALRAYQIWMGQRRRCNNPKHHNYRWYGALGIRVEYGSREFLGWYLEQAKDRDVSELTVGRIDHTKNYTLDNIEMQSNVENVKERNERRGLPRGRKAILIRDYKTGREIAVAKDSKEAMEITGIARCNISLLCTGLRKRTRRKDFLLSYLP